MAPRLTIRELLGDDPDKPDFWEDLDSLINPESGEGKVASFLASFSPLGDAMDVAQIGISLEEEDYTMAAMAAMGAALGPFFSAKIGGGIRDVYRNIKHPKGAVREIPPTEGFRHSETAERVRGTIGDEQLKEAQKRSPRHYLYRSPTGDDLEINIRQQPSGDLMVENILPPDAMDYPGERFVGVFEPSSQGGRLGATGRPELKNIFQQIVEDMEESTGEQVRDIMGYRIGPVSNRTGRDFIRIPRDYLFRGNK